MLQKKGETGGKEKKIRKKVSFFLFSGGKAWIINNKDVDEINSSFSADS
jgi:hypothetical protein